MKTITKTQTYKFYEPKELTKKRVEKSAFVDFDRCRVEIDELVYWEDKKVRTSSYANGIIKWDDEQKQYVKMYWGMGHPMGQLKGVLVLDSDNEEIT